MEAVLLVIHLIVAVGIIVVVLIQPSEAGGFLGNSGTMSNLMSQKRGPDVMTRLTTILAAIFFTTSLLLAIVAQNKPAEKGILDLANEAAPAAEQAVDAKPAAPAQPAKPEAPKAPISK